MIVVYGKRQRDIKKLSQKYPNVKFVAQEQKLNYNPNVRIIYVVTDILPHKHFNKAVSLYGNRVRRIKGISNLTNELNNLCLTAQELNG